VAREALRPSARERGYDTEYQEAAADFLKSHRLCTCGEPAVLVRHRISISLRPDLRMDRSNWLPGCASCNAKDVHREKRGAGQ
jgi:5-methylcytosine-specific restriction endonuclease McrA